MPITATETGYRMSGYLAGHTVQLYVLDCASCGIIFAITTDLEGRRRKDGGTFYCPNGHTMSWHEDEADRQRKRAERAEQQKGWAQVRAERLEMERDAEARSARAYRGHVTRLRNRIANGVCPVGGCRRNFANVKAHIASQHPDWAHDHPDVLT